MSATERERERERAKATQHAATLLVGSAFVQLH